ncbi:uncharacterized protein LOC124419195 [Lucilia cuprina]|uniref:uncharacterized protein LOC124419195 n=1 Tax=Lucilia cuprina TaxID=7375 RepID=UPI001F06DC49|nr:uncharacterized protein LOC124419195 [Lucilia cuprina]
MSEKIVYWNTTLGWICCAPCIWLRTSATVHKIAITTATLLVTSLLVASPILFLISTAPSQLPRDCYSDDEDCMPTAAPPPECLDPVCKIAASSIHAKLNWNFDPCVDFKNFSCSSSSNINGLASLRAIRSAQESVDLQMQQLLQHNTTSGPFRKLGRLFGSCLRQNTNSSTIRLVLDQLGGYLPIGALGPSSISQLISKIYELGPTPLIDIYYDLSYGKRPHVLLIISGPSTTSPILEVFRQNIRNHISCWTIYKLHLFTLHQLSDMMKLYVDVLAAFVENLDTECKISGLVEIARHMSVPTSDW